MNINEIDSGQYGDIVEGTQTVLRDQAAYEDLWWKLHADQDTTPDPPEVDFESQIVVAIVLGGRSTGGYSVAVDQVMANEEANEMRIEYTETVPGDGCPVTQAFTSPYVLATVNVEDGPVGPSGDVTFARSEQTNSC